MATVVNFDELDTQTLEKLLDDALRADHFRYVWQIVEERDRREGRDEQLII